MICMACRKEEPLVRIKMGNHRFCSAACVVKYAGTNSQHIPWLKSESYQMYYEMDFDEKVKGTLSEQDTSVGPKDTGHQAVPGSIQIAVEAHGSADSVVAMVELEGSMELELNGVKESRRENICLCRSGVLDVYKQRAKASGVVKQQEPKQNCSNKVCACFLPSPVQTGDKGS